MNQLFGLQHRRDRSLIFFHKTCELRYLYVSLQRFVESLNLVLCQESQESQAEQALQRACHEKQ